MINYKNKAIIPKTSDTTTGDVASPNFGLECIKSVKVKLHVVLYYSCLDFLLLHILKQRYLISPTVKAVSINNTATRKQKTSTE